jgi:multidrug efflux pump subunit AcrB
MTDSDIRSRLQRLPGAGTVSVLGGEKEEIQVLVRRDRLESKQLSLSDLADSLAAANFEYPSGTLREGERELAVKVSGLFPSPESMALHPVFFNEGGPVRIADLGEVVRGREERESFFLIDGQEAIRLGIQKKPGVSPLALSVQVKEEIRALEELYRPWCHFEILEDPSEGIKTSLFFLLASAGLGLVVTALVMKYFLKSTALALLLCGVIPLCAAAALPVLLLAHRSLNTLSLSGLSIGIGMVVDAGAVVIENIQAAMKNHYSKPAKTRRANGESSALSERAEAAASIIQAAGEVSLSNTGSALTTILAFLPVFFIPGLLGELFSDMALAVMASIAASCFLSMTYIPCVYSLLSKKSAAAGYTGQAAAKSEPAWIKKAEGGYGRYLKKVLRRPSLILLPLSFTLILGGISLARIEFSLFPETASRTAVASVSFAPGTSLSVLERRAQEINAELRRLDCVASLQISGGLEQEDYLRQSDPAEQREKLVLRAALNRAAPDVIPQLNAVLPDAGWTSGGASDPFARFASSVSGGLLVLSGSPESLRDPALPERIAAFLSSQEPATERQSREGSYPGNEFAAPVLVPSVSLSETVFSPDRLASARFSINVSRMASAARSALEGTLSLPLYEEGREIPVRVKFREGEILSLTDIGNTGIAGAEGFIPLRLLGSLEKETREKILYRYNRRDAKQIPSFFNAAGFTGGSLPVWQESSGGTEDPVTLEAPGVEEKNEMIREGALLLSVTILLLYLLMGAQFESFVIPLLMLLALPFAFCGALLFLLAAGRSLNINGIIALMVLFGISVNNGIILYESCTARGKISAGSILNGCRKKLRALLITNISTLLALVPFALDPARINPQASLSLAVIGGLLVSSALVTLIMPAGFLLLLPRGKGKEKINNKKAFTKNAISFFLKGK